MKRLLLLGGRPWLAKDEGEGFAAALLRYFPEQVKLAFCIFAQPEDQWEETRVWNINMLKRFRNGRKIEYQTMTVDNFKEISAWADIIYVPGGDPGVLLQKLKSAGDVLALWDDKLVAGSSAGADFMCEGFIYLQDKSYGRGLGWVKASCIPHWRSEEWKDYKPNDWDEVEQKALKVRPDLPVLCVPEGDFVEFTVE